MTIANIIFAIIKEPYVEFVRESTSLSKNHKSVGPVIISMPNAIVIIPEYRGNIASVSFTL